MATFNKSSRSNKFNECRRLSKHIAGAAAAMGLIAKIDKSSQSASHYVYVASCADADDRIKIRCSDHNDKHGGSELYAWAGECPSITIASLAAHFSRAVPAGYRPADYAARAAKAKQAAAKRNQDRHATESYMISHITEAMKGGKNVTAVVAGKILDALYPDTPRAQRQRIANAASYAANRERAIAAAAAASDENRLAELATRHHEAKAALLALVGPDRFPALRPAGFPRSLWTVSP